MIDFGISLHPFRWQWTATKLAINGFVCAVLLLIATTLAAVVWMVSPYQIPESVAGWAIWLPASVAALLVQLSFLVLQITCTTVLITTIPIDHRRRPGGWRSAVVAVAGVRDVQMGAVAYAGLGVGTIVMRHAPNAAILLAALLPLAASLNALRGLRDSVSVARPTTDGPPLTDAAIDSSYSSTNSFAAKYGIFWLDPLEIQTVSVARAYASMAAQQRINIIFVNVVAVASLSLINVILPSAEQFPLIARAVIIGFSVAVMVYAGSRAVRLRDVQDHYIDRVEDLDGQA